MKKENYCNYLCMKKIILICSILLFAISSFGQIDINTLNEIDKRIVMTFKDLYVEKKFKDPYSFKLLKLETKPITLGEWGLKDLTFLTTLLIKKDFKILSESEILDRIKPLRQNYSLMNDSTKKLIKSYEVILDCYGNNSYGGQILGRYSFNFVLIDRSLKPINYYDNPSSFITYVKELNKPKKNYNKKDDNNNNITNTK